MLFNSDIVSSVRKIDDGVVESILFSDFVFWGCFNCHGALNGWWSGAESLIYGQLKLSLFIALAKILECERSISRSSLYGYGIDQGNEDSNLVRVEYSSVLNFRVGLIRRGVGSQHKFVKVVGSQ